ncbi:hypothetical protein SLS62_003487 [Diatrype stigma]|uniref:Uncharacterized protein n=1 Tax=Diatrype stigma TaxID=117547 RepID=A0AAN9UW91_9PEZI
MAGDYLTLDPVLNAPNSFSDLPEDEALYWAKRLSCHSAASYKEKFTYPGYNDVEMHYIVCEDDKVIPAEYQYQMIETAKKSSGKDVVLHKIKSGHIPVISQPDTVAKILKGVVESM